MWLSNGCVHVDGKILSQKHRVAGNEQVHIEVPTAPSRDWVAEDIALDVIHEDAHIIVVNKPPGLVVHPGAGNPSGTMLNALLYRDSALVNVARAGIVHRLDKNTSGLLVVARTEKARLNLVRQLKSRSVQRHYLALVQGVPISGGTIDVPVGRDIHDRTRMVAGRGRPATTHYRVVERYRCNALVRVQLDTGRTHQIRVHLRHAGYPVVGDPEYSSKPKFPPAASADLIAALSAFRRQALHAGHLGIVHPETGRRCSWSVDMPQDMQNLVINLLRDVQKNAP